jgi:hypothetical protein
VKLLQCIFADNDSMHIREYNLQQTYGKPKKMYGYVCADDKVKVSDFAVVIVNETFRIVKVIEVQPLDNQRQLAYKPAFAIFDLDTYQKELQKETERQLIRGKLKAKVDLLREDDQYRQLAAIDPRVCGLVRTATGVEWCPASSTRQ